MGSRSLSAMALAVTVAGAAACLAACRHPGAAASPRGAPPDEARPAQSRLVRIEYEAQMQVPPGEQEARLWLPLPLPDAHQQVSAIVVDCNDDHYVYNEPTYGNCILCVQRKGARGGPLEATLSATVRREAYRLVGRPGGALAAGGAGVGEAAASLPLFLRPEAMVPVTGKVAAEAQRVVSPGMTELQKVRAMYDHLTRTFSYDKTVPGYGRGDALYACDVRKGNCSDVHSLFIGMARSQGIPARLLMGFPLPEDRRAGEIPSYHCWAEFHLEGAGWVPLDISEAIKQPARHEELFGGLDADRVQFTVGRDIELCPGPVPGPQNYLIYPVGTVGDRLTEVKWTLSFRDVEA